MSGPSFRIAFIALLSWALACPLAGCEGAKPDRPNVLIVLIDTLRKDHLQTYGYDRPTSPNIDRLAARGWVFDNHVAPASQTVPSTLSMLLSLHPVEHGFPHRTDRQFTDQRPRYPDELEFLAETFAAAGYATGGFVGNPFLRKINGFDQGFEIFGYPKKGAGDDLSDKALYFLNTWRRDAERPFFLYLHYFDVHAPYEPPMEYLRHFPYPANSRVVYADGEVEEAGEADRLATIAYYDACIAFVDAQIERVLSEVDDLGVADDTIVVLTSDHGEEFLEHGGYGHGTTVYGELVRVPLILVYPRELTAGRRAQHLTNHLDVAPTVLRLAGLDRPTIYRGNWIWESSPVAHAEEGTWRAVYRGDQKLVSNEATGERWRFDAADELDLSPLDAAESDAEDELDRDLDAYRDLERRGPLVAPSGAGEWSPEELDHLRALGYVEDPGTEAADSEPGFASDSDEDSTLPSEARPSL